MPVAEIQIWPIVPEYTLEVTAVITSVVPGRPPTTKDVTIKGTGNLPSRRVPLEDGDSLKIDVKLIGTQQLDPQQSSTSVKPKA